MELNAVGGQSEMVFPRAQYCGQFCLTSSLTIWTKRSSVPSVSLQMTPSWAEVSDLLKSRKALQRDLNRLD